jgi:two-component system, cell cycle sensor histidine kinase and response regulator CckA
MSGGEVFDRLVAVDPEVRVLISTGYSLDSRAQALSARGCRGYLQKPFTLEALSTKVRACIATPK